MTDDFVVGSAPASSANLGPGFDTIAVALQLRCRVKARPSSEWSISHAGPEPFSAPASEDAVLSAARAVSTEPLTLEVDSEVPVSRGLGSSAAAYTAGALAAMRAGGADPDHDQLFDVVCDLEGHPDNAAAAVYGGLVAVAGGQVVHLTWHEDLIPIAAVPGTQLRTPEARRVLPDAYPMPVVSRSLGRLAALIEGLRTARPDLLARAAGDELHEAPRAVLDPQVASVMEAARHAGALHACWSGAGPSVLCVAQTSAVEGIVGRLSSALGDGGRVMVLAPDRQGAL